MPGVSQSLYRTKALAQETLIHHIAFVAVWDFVVVNCARYCENRVCFLDIKRHVHFDTNNNSVGRITVLIWVANWKYINLLRQFPFGCVGYSIVIDKFLIHICRSLKYGPPTFAMGSWTAYLNIFHRLTLWRRICCAVNSAFDVSDYHLLEDRLRVKFKVKIVCFQGSLRSQLCSVRTFFRSMFRSETIELFECVLYSLWADIITAKDFLSISFEDLYQHLVTGRNSVSLRPVLDRSRKRRQSELWADGYARHFRSSRASSALLLLTSGADVFLGLQRTRSWLSRRFRLASRDHSLLSGGFRPAICGLFRGRSFSFLVCRRSWIEASTFASPPTFAAHLSRESIRRQIPETIVQSRRLSRELSRGKLPDVVAARDGRGFLRHGRHGDAPSIMTS